MQETFDEMKSLLRKSLSGGRTQIEPEGFTKAAVLVPLIEGDRDYRLLFTKRTDFVETHKGQVSFPGGMVDSGDADIVQTALREAYEEIGIPERLVEVIGLLDDLRTPTGFVITPVIGVIEKLPELTPNPDEVSEVFDVPLAFFVDPTNARKEKRMHRGKTHDVWLFDYQNHTIWGATALIIRSLLRRLKAVGIVQ